MGELLSAEAMNASVGRASKATQAYVRRLEMRIAELTEDIKERNEQIGATNTVVVDYRGVDGHRPLPMGSTVGFGVKDSDRSDVPDFQVRHLFRRGNMGMGEVGDLEISGVTSIAVIPQASNVVIVRLNGRR